MFRRLTSHTVSRIPRCLASTATAAAIATATAWAYSLVITIPHLCLGGIQVFYVMLESLTVMLCAHANCSSTSLLLLGECDAMPCDATRSHLCTPTFCRLTNSRNPPHPATPVIMEHCGMSTLTAASGKNSPVCPRSAVRHHKQRWKRPASEEIESTKRESQ
jgi:hypothetical protein